MLLPGPSTGWAGPVAAICWLGRFRPGRVGSGVEFGPLVGGRCAGRGLGTCAQSPSGQQVIERVRAGADDGQSEESEREHGRRLSVVEDRKEIVLLVDDEIRVGD